MICLDIIKKNGKRMDFKAIMEELSARGITRLLVEGGGSLAASLMLSDLVDEIAWFRAPTIMGDDGVSAVANLGLDKLDEITKFDRKYQLTLGDDSLEVLVRTR